MGGTSSQYDEAGCVKLLLILNSYRLEEEQNDSGNCHDSLRPEYQHR